MKDFANAAFPPEVISVMEAAFDAAVASLPDPVSSTHVQHLAEAILRAATTVFAHNGYFNCIAFLSSHSLATTTSSVRK